MLPAVASSSLFFLLARCGWATELAAGWDFKHAPVSGPLFSSKDLSLSTWTAKILHLTNPLRFGDINFPLYNYPLWTMPVEYMGSMVVFVVIIGTALLRPALRLTAVTVLCLYSLWLAPWKWALFISGVLLADMCDHSATDAAPISVLSFASTIDEEGAVKNDRQTSYLENWAGYFKPFNITNARLNSMLDMFLFILALYLGSAPSGDPAELAAAPGYSWLSPWIPRSWGMSMGYFYPDIGAILLVSVITRAEFLQRIFTTSIAQYLGDISLSLYMLHVVVLHTLGNWLIVQCSAATRPLGAWGFTVGIWGMFCLSLPSGPH
jgi:peptidoglycan/LPS O-acetylase OafA/YrhL